jgi:hypothetical protein
MKWKGCLEGLAVCESPLISCTLCVEELDTEGALPLLASIAAVSFGAGGALLEHESNSGDGDGSDGRSPALYLIPPILLTTAKLISCFVPVPPLVFSLFEIDVFGAACTARLVSIAGSSYQILGSMA